MSSFICPLDAASTCTCPYPYRAPPGSRIAPRHQTLPASPLPSLLSVASLLWRALGSCLDSSKARASSTTPLLDPHIDARHCAGRAPPAGGGSTAVVRRRRHASDPFAPMAVLVCAGDPREGCDTAPPFDLQQHRWQRDGSAPPYTGDRSPRTMPLPHPRSTPAIETCHLACAIHFRVLNKENSFHEASSLVKTGFGLFGFEIWGTKRRRKILKGPNVDFWEIWETKNILFSNCNANAKIKIVFVLLRSQLINAYPLIFQNSICYLTFVVANDLWSDYPTSIVWSLVVYMLTLFGCELCKGCMTLVSFWKIF